jgi:hypothetical protein
MAVMVSNCYNCDCDQDVVIEEPSHMIGLYFLKGGIKMEFWTAMLGVLGTILGILIFFAFWIIIICIIISPVLLVIVLWKLIKKL